MNLVTNEALKEFGLSGLDIEKVLREALTQGGELAEAFFENTESTRLILQNKKMDQISEGTDQGMGLRVIYEGRSVYGYSCDLSENALLKLALDLSVAVKTKTPSNLGKIDFLRTKAKSSEIEAYKVQRSARALSLKEKQKIILRAESKAYEILPDAKQVTAAWLDSKRKILIVNSDGVVSSHVKNYLQCFVQVVGEKDGKVETAHESKGGFVGLEFFEKVSPESIGESAAKRVKILLSAVAAPSGSVPVVLSSEAGGTMIHEAVGHGLEADLACNGLSVYQGKIGQKVASSLVTVIDDGSMPELRGSYTFDDEGTASTKNVLIENGILKSYLVDQLSARKFDLMATGNGRRESFRSKPIVRMTNTYIAPGKDDPAQILKDTKWGIFVKAMGGGQVDTVTGDFVFAVTEGYLIQDGKLTHPIRGATLVGNGPKVLESVDRVGSDLGFSTGTCGKDGQGAPVTDAQPTIRIPSLTVGGEVPLETYFKV